MPMTPRNPLSKNKNKIFRQTPSKSLLGMVTVPESEKHKLLKSVKQGLILDCIYTLYTTKKRLLKQQKTLLCKIKQLQDDSKGTWRHTNKIISNKPVLKQWPIPTKPIKNCHGK